MINAAYAMRQEDVTGSLTEGKDADLIVVDFDPVTVDPESIASALVLQTFVGGNEVFRSDQF